MRNKVEIENAIKGLGCFMQDASRAGDDEKGVLNMTFRSVLQWVAGREPDVDGTQSIAKVLDAAEKTGKGVYNDPAALVCQFHRNKKKGT